MTTSCSTVRPLLFAALEGQVSSEERIQIHAHLAHCEACRSFERSERALTDVLAPRSEVAPAKPRNGRRLAATFGVAAAATLLVFVLPAATPEGSIVERRLGPGMEWEVAGESDVSTSNEFRVPGTGGVDIRLGKGVHLTANGPTGFALDFVDKRWEVVVSEGVVRAEVSKGGSLVARYRTGSAVLGRGTYELTPNGVREPEQASSPAKGAAQCIAEGQKLFSEVTTLSVMFLGDKAKEAKSLAAAEKLFVQALLDRRITSDQRATALFYLAAAQGRQGRPADALETERRWLAEFPSHPDRPHVMFYAAAYHEDLGQLEEARRGWRQVMKEFPSSPWASHAKAYLDTMHKRVKSLGAAPQLRAVVPQVANRAVQEWMFPDASRSPGDVMVDQGLRRFRLMTAAAFGVPAQWASWQENMAAAEALFGEALQDPSLAAEQRRKALFYLSAAHSWQNSPTKALKASQMWLAENPQHADRPHVMFYAAWYLERLGRLEESQNMRARIRTEFPKSPWADHAKSYMDTIDKRVKARAKRSRKSVRAPGRLQVELQWPAAAQPAKSADK